MSEFTDEEERIWEKGLILLLQERQHESALSLFKYLFDDCNITGRARGILLTGIAEAEFALGLHEQAIRSNFRSIKYFPGKRSTYKRIIHMSRTSGKHMYVIYAQFLYIKNFFKIVSDIAYVIGNDIDASRI